MWFDPSQYPNSKLYRENFRGDFELSDTTIIFELKGIVDHIEIEGNIIIMVLAEEWYGRITVYSGNLFIIEDVNMHVLQ